MRYTKSTYMNLIMATLVLLELIAAVKFLSGIPCIVSIILTISFIGATCDAWQKMQRRAKG